MSHAKRFVVIAGIATLVAGPAAAQSLPQVEIAAGYMRLLDASASLNTTTSRPAMDGWHAEIAVVQSRRISWVAMIDGAIGRDDGQSAYGDRNQWKDFSAAGGIRLTSRAHARFVPYAQILAGRFHTTQSYRSRGSMHEISTNTLLFQPGIGINMFLTPRFGVRLGADLKYLPNFDWIDDSGWSMSRIMLGGVVALGQK